MLIFRSSLAAIEDCLKKVTIVLIFVTKTFASSKSMVCVATKFNVWAKQGRCLLVSNVSLTAFRMFAPLSVTITTTLSLSMFQLFIIFSIRLPKTSAVYCSVTSVISIVVDGNSSSNNVLSFPNNSRCWVYRSRDQT